MPTILYHREQLMDLLSTPGDPLIPELDDAVAHPEKYIDRGYISIWRRGLRWQNRVV